MKTNGPLISGCEISMTIACIGNTHEATSTTISHGFVTIQRFESKDIGILQTQY